MRSPTFFFDRLCILTTPGLEALGEALLFFSMVSNTLCSTCMLNLRDSELQSILTLCDYSSGVGHTSDNHT